MVSNVVSVYIHTSISKYRRPGGINLVSCDSRNEAAVKLCNSACDAVDLEAAERSGCYVAT